MILGAEHPYYMEPGYGGWEGNIAEDTNVDEVSKLWDLVFYHVMNAITR